VDGGAARDPPRGGRPGAARAGPGGRPHRRRGRGAVRGGGRPRVRGLGAEAAEGGRARVPRAHHAAGDAVAPRRGHGRHVRAAGGAAARPEHRALGLARRRRGLDARAERGDGGRRPAARGPVPAHRPPRGGRHGVHGAPDAGRPRGAAVPPRGRRAGGAARGGPRPRGRPAPLGRGPGPGAARPLEADLRAPVGRHAAQDHPGHGRHLPRPRRVPAPARGPLPLAPRRRARPGALEL